MNKIGGVARDNVFFFPEEIIYEILSWLQVKPLLICKSVCKLWYSAINNNRFVELHAIRNAHRFYTIENRYKIPKSFGIEGNIQYRSNCCGGGFVVAMMSPLESDKSDMRMYRICNPSTKRILDLPRPHEGFVTMFVFLNSSTSSYNVVSAYYDKDCGKVKLELIDLGGQSTDPYPNANLSWRTLNNLEFDKLGYHFLYCMSSEGVLYILALRIVQAPSNPKIICIDLVDKACTTLNAPQSLLLKTHEVNFHIWRGKPSIVFRLEEKMNVWMLEDYKKQRWDDTISIPLPFLKQNPFLKSVYPSICCGDEEDLLIYRFTNQGCYVYKLESKELCTIPSTLLRVPATLVSVKGMQPEKKTMHDSTPK